MTAKKAPVYAYGLEAARAAEAELGMDWSAIERIAANIPRPCVAYVRCMVWAGQLMQKNPPTRINVDAGIDSSNRTEYLERILPAIAANTVDADLDAERIESERMEAERIEAEQAEAGAAQGDDEYGNDDD